MSLRRWLPFACVAAFAHLAVGAAVGWMPERSGELVKATETAPEVLDLDVEPAQPRAVPEPSVAESRSASPVAYVATLHEGRVGASARVQEQTSPEPAGPVSAPESSSDSSWTFDPTVPPSPTSAAVIARAVQPQVHEFGKQLGRGTSAGGIAEALTARDVDLGLGQGGQVLSAFEARTRTMDVAIEGWALFDVGIDSSGRVSVSVTDASTARDAWVRLARATVADVDVKRIHVPAGARGWRIAVRIEAKEQYPDGERPKDMGGHVTTTGFKESKTSMVMESLPSLTLATRGKVCSVGLNWTFPSPLPGIVGGCNPENAGVQDIRVVSGRIVEEGPL